MPDFNNNLHNNAGPSTYEMGRILRQVQTKAEEILWPSPQGEGPGVRLKRPMHFYFIKL